jgi:sortase A
MPQRHTVHVLLACTAVTLAVAGMVAVVRHRDDVKCQEGNESSIGHVEIASIRLSVDLVESSNPDCRVGHLRETPLPGDVGNSVLVGHRSGGASVFHDLDRVKPNDRVVVTTAKGVFTFIVTAQPDGQGSRVIEATDFSVGKPTTDARLTLLSDYPSGDRERRLIVQAQLGS